jgi:hypothetical protein
MIADRMKSLGRQVRTLVATWVYVAIFGCALAACSSSQPQMFQQTLKDTTGASFHQSCPPSGCAITSTAAMPAACYGWTIFNASRIAVLCSNSNVDANCRPFTCTNDGDCPQAQGWSLVCRATVCQNLKLPLGEEDVIALCLASTPRSGLDCVGQQSPAAQAVQAEAMAACKNDCTVPAGCLQP